MNRTVPLLLGLVLTTALVPVASAGKPPTQGQCDGVPVPLDVQIGLVCAHAGTGANAACPPSSSVPMEVTCTTTYSWTWLANSRVNLAGVVDVRIRHDVEVCVDRVGAEPECTHHPVETTESCAWSYGEDCRGEGRVDESWGPVFLNMGEEFKVLVHIDIHMEARSNLAGVPIGQVEYGDFSDWGAAVTVLDDGRG